MTQAQALDARYAKGSRHRTDVIIAGVVLGILGIIAGWFAWHTLTPQHNVETRDIAVKLTDPKQAEITYEVTATPDTQTACALQALDNNHAIIGLRVVTHEPSQQATNTYRTTLKTTAQAVAVTVDKCWIVKHK